MSNFRSAGCVLLDMVFSTRCCGCGPKEPVCSLVHCVWVCAHSAHSFKSTGDINLRHLTLRMPHVSLHMTQILSSSIHLQYFPDHCGPLPTTVISFCVKWLQTEECDLNRYQISLPILCMCDRALYMKMTRDTNLMQQLWFIIINNSTCFGHLYVHLQECRLCTAACGVQHYVLWLWS